MNWMQTLKDSQTLLVIDYLVKGGSERVIDAVRDHLHNVRTLTDFQFIDGDGVDQGLNGEY